MEQSIETFIALRNSVTAEHFNAMPGVKTKPFMFNGSAYYCQLDVIDGFRVWGTRLLT